MSATSYPVGAKDASRPELDRVYKKVSRRLIPFIFICYMISYLDRTNIGFAKLQMADDLELSGAAYGLGAGIFFIGYVLFEIPSNLLMTKIGARRTLVRIMILWGLASAATAFVTTPMQFYVVRFFLGMFEAGFVPGILLYLTYWYSGKRRGAAAASFLAAAAFAGAIGAPVSGAILQGLDGAAGLSGWQWMFIIEAAPAIIAAILLPRFLDDRPRDAKWLTSAEKDLLEKDVADDSRHQQHNFKAALRQPRLYLLGFIYFSLLSGVYLISFFLPTIISKLGDFNAGMVGLITGIPYIAAAVATVWLGRRSDRMNERRWHIVGSISIGMIAMICTIFTDNAVLSIALFTVATAGIFAAFPLLWPLPGMFFTGTAIAGALALINSMGTFSGFVIPYISGWLMDLTGNLHSTIVLIAGIVLLGIIGLIRGIPAQPSTEEQPEILEGSKAR